jgi:putative membrane protein
MEQPPAASEGDEAPPSELSQTQVGAAPSDGQLLEILATVDSGEVAQAQLAISKATSTQVRDFANAMIDQHSRAKQQGTQLAAEANLTPAPSPTSRELQRKGDAMITELHATEAAQFDETYMQSQIKQHKEVLDMLDNQLLPSAGNASCREYIMTARSMVQHHLTQAQQVERFLTR